jgi:hypothetical protein
MENRKSKLTEYSNLDILKIFDNCHSISEITHAGVIFLILIDEGVITDQQRRIIYIRMEIRKRQL